MVVHLFCKQGRSGHEAEGLVEILEGEGFANGIAILALGPAFEGSKGHLALIVAKRFWSGHRHVSLVGGDHAMTSQEWYRRFDQAPPSLKDFQRIGEEVLASLPPLFADPIQGVMIKVEEFPDAETEKLMELESPYDLLGLYHGVPVGYDEGFGALRHNVDMIFLYRRPLLAYWCDTEDSLSAIIKNTLIHEIGHHFGLSDDDMDRIEFGGSPVKDGA